MNKITIALGLVAALAVGCAIGTIAHNRCIIIGVDDQIYFTLSIF